MATVSLHLKAFAVMFMIYSCMYICSGPRQHAPQIPYQNGASPVTSLRIAQVLQLNGRGLCSVNTKREQVLRSRGPQARRGAAHLFEQVRR